MTARCSRDGATAEVLTCRRDCNLDGRRRSFVSQAEDGIRDATVTGVQTCALPIVTGVGFLGAGTILHTRGTVTGLTSAATIWLVAAIGVAVGAGAIYEAAGATLLVLLVLRALRAIEPFVRRRAVVSRLRVEVDA